MAGLELREVARNFGGLQAVGGVSMHVPAGRVTGLIGPNGAGKTTLVNLVTGLLRPSAGQIMLDDRDISLLAPQKVARLGVARTFQTVRLLDEATSLANVVIGAHRLDRTSLLQRLLGLPVVRRQDRELARRAQQFLDAFGIGEFATVPAGQLAYGHRRLVEIARALAMEPGVLLLDEPVAGMNDTEANELAHHVRALAARGLAVLLIEHNMNFVMGVCDHVYVLSSGRLIAEGSATAVQADQRVIEAYLGS